MARKAAEADGIVLRSATSRQGSYVIQAFGRPQGGGTLARAPFGSRRFDVPDGGRNDLVVQTGACDRRADISRSKARPRRLGRARSACYPQPADFISAPSSAADHLRLSCTTTGRSRSTTWPDAATSAQHRRGGLVLKRVTLDGRDITDEPVDFRKGDIDGLEITLTSNAATITGAVTDNGAPATGYGVLVFADDNSEVDVPLSVHRVGRAESDRQLSRDRPAAWRPIAWLRCPRTKSPTRKIPSAHQVVVFATSVLVGEGETQTVALKLTKR